MSRRNGYLWAGGFKANEGCCDSTSAGARANALDLLNDVTITAAADKEILQYNNGANEWQNVSIPVAVQSLSNDTTSISIGALSRAYESSVSLGDGSGASLIFGASENTFLGHDEGGNLTTPTQCISIGNGSNTYNTLTPTLMTCVGLSCVGNTRSFTAGYDCQSTAQNTVSCGVSCVASGADSVAIGSSAQSTGISSIAIGDSALAAHTDSCALGSRATTTKANQTYISGTTTLQSGLEFGNEKNWTQGKYVNKTNYIADETGNVYTGFTLTLGSDTHASLVFNIAHWNGTMTTSGSLYHMDFYGDSTVIPAVTSITLISGYDHFTAGDVILTQAVNGTLKFSFANLNGATAQATWHLQCSVSKGSVAYADFQT